VEAHAVTDVEAQHLAARARLLQVLQARHDAPVQLLQLSLVEPADVDVHDRAVCHLPGASVNAALFDRPNKRPSILSG